MGNKRININHVRLMVKGYLLFCDCAVMDRARGVGKSQHLENTAPTIWSSKVPNKAPAQVAV